MKLYKKIILIIAIIIVILLLSFYGAIWYIGRQIGGCKCMNLQPGITQNINRTLNNLDNYCFEKNLTDEEISEYTKIYQNASNIKTKFLPIDKKTEEYISCNNDNNPIFRKTDNSIIGCYCGK